MRTPLRCRRIPARLAVIAVTSVLVSSGSLAACSDDDDADTTGSSVAAPTSSAVASTAPGAGTTAGATTVPLPPDDTSDIPLPPTGTGDLPVYTPPETSDVPVYISVTVGTDDSPQRVEAVPLGSPVTIDVLNLEASDEYRLQGYELGAGEVMGPGETKTFSFVANQVGEFVLESLATGEVLLTLDVG